MDKIIVQETDPHVLDVLVFALKYEGFDVLGVQDYNTDFISLIEETKPHVIILDYRLRGDAAKELCYNIKSKYPHLPIIATSCNYNINQLYNLNGFDDYIHKPFDLDLLYRIIKKYI